MPPHCSETKSTTTALTPSSNHDDHSSGTTPQASFKSKFIPVTPEPPVQVTSGSVHGLESTGTQVQEIQRRGHAIEFGQPLDLEDGVVPGLGLFLDGLTSSCDTSGEKVSYIIALVIINFDFHQVSLPASGCSTTSSSLNLFSAI